MEAAVPRPMGAIYGPARPPGKLSASLTLCGEGGLCVLSHVPPHSTERSSWQRLPYPSVPRALTGVTARLMSFICLTRPQVPPGQCLTSDLAWNACGLHACAWGYRVPPCPLTTDGHKRLCHLGYEDGGGGPWREVYQLYTELEGEPGQQQDSRPPAGPPPFAVGSRPVTGSVTGRLRARLAVGPGRCHPWAAGLRRRLFGRVLACGRVQPLSTGHHSLPAPRFTATTCSPKG